MSLRADFSAPTTMTAGALALVLASAYAGGGETLAGQGLVVAAGGFGLGALALTPAAAWPRSLRWAAAGWAGLVVWCLIQAAPFGVLEHPAWAGAGRALDGPLVGAIAVDPQAAMDAAARLAAYAGLFAAGWSAAHGPRGPGARLALAIAGLAALSLFAVDWDTGAAGLAKVRQWGDLSFPFANRNHLCVFVGIGAIVAATAGLAAPAANGWWRALMGAAMLACLAAAFASHSRAGLGALGAGLGAALLPLLAGREWILWGLAAGAALALAFAAGTLARLDTLGDAAALRLTIVGEAFRLSTERPILGVGSFDQAFQAVAPAFPQGLVLSAHNVLAESLVERGWPATALALAALVLVLGQCARSIAADGDRRVRGAAAIGVATMVSLHGMVDFSVHVPTIAALVAFVLGSGAAPSRQPAPAPPAKVARGTRVQGARA